jgi:hypothetical protein
MRIFLLSVALVVTSGCSTMESLKSSNTQNILVETPRVEGAECKLTDKSGRKWNLWETPGTVAIQEGHPPLVIICTKKGFKTSILTVNEHKEELLTIDGKRIDLSIYGDFPTKFPRLIPSAIKETAGFVQDPTGSISTTYPNKLVVWMEPKKWESEEQMREWAFDRQVQDSSDFIDAQDAKVADEKRKEVRREDKKKREEELRQLKKRLRDAGKRGVHAVREVLNPEPGLGNASESGKVILDGAGVDRARGGVKIINEETGTALRKGVNALGDQIKPETGKPLNGLNPGAAVDFLNNRNEVKAKTRAYRLKNSGDEVEDSGGTYGVAPEELPAKSDANMPLDLYQEPGGYNIRYDDKGNRIVP